jgi:hypothetical protein
MPADSIDSGGCKVYQDMVGSYSVHLEATIRRVIQFCCTHAAHFPCCPMTSDNCVGCFEMFRLLCVARMFRRTFIASAAFLLSLHSLLQTPSRRHTPHNLQIYPHHSIIMCFRTSTSVESSSSSSSDEPIARIIDLPTVRRVNSPRCAARGNAYLPGASAASDRTQSRVVGHAAAVDADKQKDRMFKDLSAVCAMLTMDYSQEVSTSIKDKTRSLYSKTFSSRYVDER